MVWLRNDAGSGVNDMSSKIRVLLIEDSPLLRDVLTDTLRELDEVELCGCAEDQQGALDFLAHTPVDLAIVDIELKAGSGIGVLEALRQDPGRYGPPRTVIFSNHAHPAMRERCAKLGSDAFFDKSLELEQLVSYVSHYGR